jgi:hypothetical protein
MNRWSPNAVRTERSAPLRHRRSSSMTAHALRFDELVRAPGHSDNQVTALTVRR